MKKILCLVIIFVLAFVPIPTLAKKVKVEKTDSPLETQLEKREFQTRIYNTKDTKMVMKSAINTLQDEGFNLSNANTELGIITAQKEFDVHMSTGKEILIRSVYAVAFGIIGLMLSENVVKSSVHSISASVNVSEFGKQTKVRVNFTEKTKKNSAKVEDIKDEKIYQAFFEKLDKSLFIQNQGI
ncbi:MAG: hypothetical protein WCY19_06510 [Candidatus Gastranaerophilaceae bacterium]